MVEPVATVTDYLIALECLLFGWLLLHLSWPKRLWAAAFGSVAIAALLGGTYHGFVSTSEMGRHYIWQGTVLALAIASFLMLVAAAWHTPWHTQRGWRLGWTTLASVKLILLLSLETETWGFAVLVVDYLSALGVALLLQEETVWMASGIALSGVAACFLIIPRPFALIVSPLVGYHLIQMVALYCIYRSVSKAARDRARIKS